MRRQGWRAASRGLICGYVDSYTLLTFGLYTSFMSGNTIATGMNGGQAKYAAASHALLPIPFFVLGATLGFLMQKAKSQQQNSRVSMCVAALLLLEVAAAIGAASLSVCVMILSCAMGMMNTTVSQVGGQSVNLGFVTGDLKNLGEHVANIVYGAPVAQSQGSWDTHWRRIFLLGGIWTCFLVGAIGGAAMATRVHVWTLMLPALFLVLLVVTERSAGSPAVVAPQILGGHLEA
nr:YoaK family protein [Acidipila sp. EB88]